jgi:hypothetical protein
LKPLNGLRHNFERKRLLWHFDKHLLIKETSSNRTDALRKRDLRICQYEVYGLDRYDTMKDPNIRRKLFSLFGKGAGIVYSGTCFLPFVPLSFSSVPSVISETSQKSETHGGSPEICLPFTLILITSSFSSDSLIPLENNWKLYGIECCLRNFTLM